MKMKSVIKTTSNTKLSPQKSPNDYTPKRSIMKMGKEFTTQSNTLLSKQNMKPYVMKMGQ